MVELRTEQPRDREAVRELNESAFGRREEADLIEALHLGGVAAVALVAEVDGVVAGHILFSPVTVEPTGKRELRVFGLGPMAVLPALQNQGVGGLLVREGIERCRAAGVQAVVVLGHPAYYPRFGFAPADRFGLRSEYEVPSEAFMALELEPGCLGKPAALVRYHEAFA